MSKRLHGRISEGRSADIVDDAGDDVALALDRADDSVLPVDAAAAPSALILVLVLVFAADVRLIDLNNAARAC